MILDCGHEPSPHSEYTTGTAHTSDNREICWDCSYAGELSAMRTAQHYGAYLSGNGSRLTTWPGQPLAVVTSLVERRVGFGGSRFYFKATDLDGQHWHGTSPGPGMYARLHRSKA